MMAGVAKFLSDKIDFKTKILARDKKRHYIMIKDKLNKIIKQL